MYTLFAAKNTIAVASVLMMEEVGLDYDLSILNFQTGDQLTPDYHKINPKGRVPALVFDGQILTETGAILEYLAGQHPQANLMPDDPMQAARVRELMFYLASTMHVNHAHKLRGSRWANESASFADMTAKVPETMGASCEYVEGCLAGPYLLGNAPTIADIYLYAVCRWLEGDGVDITQYPKLSAFFETYGARPAVAAAQEKGVI